MGKQESRVFIGGEWVKGTNGNVNIRTNGRVGIMSNRKVGVTTNGSWGLGIGWKAKASDHD